jgi:hypothetical protein
MLVQHNKDVHFTKWQGEHLVRRERGTPSFHSVLQGIHVVVLLFHRSSAFAAVGTWSMPALDKPSQETKDQG